MNENSTRPDKRTKNGWEKAARSKFSFSKQIAIRVTKEWRKCARASKKEVEKRGAGNFWTWPINLKNPRVPRLEERSSSYQTRKWLKLLLLFFATCIHVHIELFSQRLWEKHDSIAKGMRNLRFISKITDYTRGKSEKELEAARVVLLFESPALPRVYTCISDETII